MRFFAGPCCAVWRRSAPFGPQGGKLASRWPTAPAAGYGSPQQMTTGRVPHASQDRSRRLLRSRAGRLHRGPWTDRLRLSRWSKTERTLPDLATNPALAADLDHLPELLGGEGAPAGDPVGAPRLADQPGRSQGGPPSRRRGGRSTLGTTKDWLRRHGDRLPFTLRLSRGQVRFSAKGIDRYIASRVSGRRALADVRPARSSLSPAMLPAAAPRSRRSAPSNPLRVSGCTDGRPGGERGGGTRSSSPIRQASSALLAALRALRTYTT